MLTTRSLYVVAHPEATHHVDHMVGGWHDSVLTPTGQQAATRIGAALRATIPASARVEVYSSDLRRAQQTATVIADVLQVEPVLDRRLREKSYGEAEGKPQAWLDERFVAPPAAGDRMHHHEGVAGAETRAELARRVYSVVDAILESPCRHQVIVTHGFALTFVVASWIKMPIESVAYVNFRAASGSVTLLREDDYFHNRQVARLGDLSHLAG